MGDGEKETLQLTKFMENIPIIEITPSDGAPSYISFAEVNVSIARRIISDFVKTLLSRLTNQTSRLGK